MKIVKKHVLVAVSVLLIGISCDIHAMGGPQIQTYDTILKNMFQQAITGVQNFFSYIASSLGTAVKTSSPPPVTISKSQSIPTWVTFAGAILTATTRESKAGALKKLLAYIHNPSSTETSPQFQKFSELPLELKTKIIAFATLNSSAKTLSEATQAIRALSKVNKQFNTILNKLINDPEFCLKIIKSLGQQFNVSDEEAAKALGTAEARNRLKIQEPLYSLCQIQGSKNVRVHEEQLRKLQALLKKNPALGIAPDPNFTYMEKVYSPGKFDPYKMIFTRKEHIEDPVSTPLMMTLKRGNYPLAKDLLDHGSDINQVTPNKETALIKAIKWNVIPTLKFLLDQKDIAIEKKIPPYDNTALMVAVKEVYSTANIESVQLLLDAGANPTITNNQGESAESLVSKKSDLQGKQKLLDLIEDAKRNKKWEKSPQ